MGIKLFTFCRPITQAPMQSFHGGVGSWVTFPCQPVASFCSWNSPVFWALMKPATVNQFHPVSTISLVLLLFFVCFLIVLLFIVIIEIDEVYIIKNSNNSFLSDSDVFKFNFIVLRYWFTSFNTFISIYLFIHYSAK